MSSASVEQNPSPEGDDLERMLAEAERLANQMRDLSHRVSSDASGSFVPDTIQIKDSGTECSSMETRNATTDSLLGSSHDFQVPEAKESISEEGESTANSSNNQGKDTLSRKLDSSFSSSIKEESAGEVNAVIQASEEMARALEAIKYDTDEPEQPPECNSPGSSTASSPESLSPFPASPQSLSGDSKMTTKVSHVSKANLDSKLAMPTAPSNEEGNVKWEKVEYTKDSDDDYVPLKDYSKEKETVHSLKPTADNGSNIKWEKVSSPARADSDYVPLKDYSKARTVPEFAPERTSTFAHHHKTLRRKRKQQKRMKIATTALLVAAIVAFLFWKQPTFLFAPPEPTGPSPEEIAAMEAAELKAAEEQKAAELAAKLAAEIATQKAEEERKIAETKALEDARAAKFMKQTCGLPLAGLLSPVCRQAGGDQGDKSFRWNQLVQAMLQ